MCEHGLPGVGELLAEISTPLLTHSSSPVCWAAFFKALYHACFGAWSYVAASEDLSEVCEARRRHSTALLLGRGVRGVRGVAGRLRVRGERGEVRLARAAYVYSGRARRRRVTCA